ncbi:MAG: TonB-dependent receptor plug domain-containing protein [Chitinispirillaceae bacterium]|nr:TonB-dependent receptor plug domain-containing protein [Chitinispirillaceae bacterium]
MRTLFRIMLLSTVSIASTFHPDTGRTMYVRFDSLPALECGDRHDTASPGDAGGKVDSCVTIRPSDSASCPAAQNLPVMPGRPSEETAPSAASDSVFSLPSMVVCARSGKKSEAEYVQSRRSVTRSDIKKKAGAAEDISRYLGSLPSVVSSLGAGYDNTLFIRGGRPSEVVFLVDGIEMENINHFSKANGSGGPIGFINSDVLASLEFYAGNMPVSYPARLSSAVDISLKKGSLYERHQSIGCKLTGGMFSAEGPIQSGKSSYSLSGRYVDFSALHSHAKNSGVPKIGDWHGKVFAIANDRLDLSATALLSWNHYRYEYPIVRSDDLAGVFHNKMNEVETILQGGGGAALRYTDDRFSHETHLTASFRDGRDTDSLGGFADTFFISRYRSNPVGSERDTRVRYAINSLSRFRFSDCHTFSAGGRTGINSYAFRERDESQFEGACIVCRDDQPVTVTMRNDPTHKQVSFYGIEPGTFLEYAYDRGPFKTAAGFRVDYFDLLQDIAISPRVSASLRPARLGTLSLSFGLYRQFPTELPSIIFASLSPSLSGDSLIRIERRLLRRVEPQRLWQGSLGYDRFFSARHEFRVETYYKWYEREYDLVTPDLRRVLFWNERGELTMADPEGKRRAMGVEASLCSHDTKSFFYSVGGSLFDVKNRYRDGSWRNDWTDVGYTFGVSLGARLLNSHTISFSLQGAGGRPFCPEKILADCIDRKFATYDNETPWFSERLDKIVNASTRYTFSRRIGPLKTEAFIEVLNALDYTPTLEYKFNGDRFVEIKPFSITPIAGCSVQW